MLSIFWFKDRPYCAFEDTDFFFLNNFIYKTITYTTYSINYTYIVLATNTTDTYTYTNYAYTTLRYMYYNTININLIYGWRVYKVLFN